MLACAAVGCATPMQTAAPADAEVLHEVIEARSTEDPMEFATDVLTFARVDPVRWTYGETGLTLEVRHEPGPVADVSCFGHIHELGRDAKCSIRVTGPIASDAPGAARLGTTNAAMILNEDADADEDAVLIVGVAGAATKWTARPVATSAPTVVGYDLYREGQWIAALDLRGELHLAASAPRASRVLAGAMAAVLLWLPGPSGRPRVTRWW
ncbi:MAG: hypothetical protein RMA76_13950 [Deltaproteobacteria bacterium]|jgi:hypothetical protein